MPALSMVEHQAVTELSDLLYDFLPASGAAITWSYVAARHGARDCWPDGPSKRQSIPIFLRNLIEHRRGQFCDTMMGIVQEGINYKSRKGKPVTRQDIEKFNQILLKVQFKIPELYDRKFLDGLPASVDETGESHSPPATISASAIKALQQRFLTLVAEPNYNKRGLALEPFLNDFFDQHGLHSRGSFRMMGEQIDGSFDWPGCTFLVEARWRIEPANNSDLLVLRGKAEKSEWTRGLFISINGFSDMASETLPVGRRANLIGMSGQDLLLILEQRWTINDALREKLRHTAETAKPFISLADLTKQAERRQKME